MSNLLYVGIPEPENVRKNVLSTAKRVITLLKDHQDYARIRNEKETNIQQLKKTLDSIASQTRKLKNILPKRNMPPTQNMPRHSCQEQKSERKQQNNTFNKIDLLEQELNKIEKRLRAF